MSSLAKAYAAELFRERRMWAAWPPDLHVTPGTIGHVDGPLFAPVGHLADLDVEASTSTSGTRANETYASAGTLVFSSAGQGLEIEDLPLQLGLDVEVRFERRHGVFVLLADCGVLRLDNLLHVASSIATLKARGLWEDDWHVVTATRTAGLGAIAISRGKGASVHLALRVNPAVGVANSLAFEFSHAKRLGLQIAAAGSLTPLVELRRATTASRVPVMRGEAPLGGVLAANGLAFVEAEPAVDQGQ